MFYHFQFQNSTQHFHHLPKLQSSENIKKSKKVSKKAIMVNGKKMGEKIKKAERMRYYVFRFLLLLTSSIVQKLLFDTH